MRRQALREARRDHAASPRPAPPRAALPPDAGESPSAGEVPAPARSTRNSLFSQTIGGPGCARGPAIAASTSASASARAIPRDRALERARGIRSAPRRSARARGAGATSPPRRATRSTRVACTAVDGSGPSRPIDDRQADLKYRHRIRVILEQPPLPRRPPRSRGVEPVALQRQHQRGIPPETFQRSHDRARRPRAASGAERTLAEQERDRAAAARCRPRRRGSSRRATRHRACPSLDRCAPNTRDHTVARRGRRQLPVGSDAHDPQQQRAIDVGPAETGTRRAAIAARAGSPRRAAASPRATRSRSPARPMANAWCEGSRWATASYSAARRPVRAENNLVDERGRLRRVVRRRPTPRSRRLLPPESRRGLP